MFFRRIFFSQTVLDEHAARRLVLAVLHTETFQRTRCGEESSFAKLLIRTSVGKADMAENINADIGVEAEAVNAR